MYNTPYKSFVVTTIIYCLLHHLPHTDMILHACSLDRPSHSLPAKPCDWKGTRTNKLQFAREELHGSQKEKENVW
jgi:hypothetical protein